MARRKRAKTSVVEVVTQQVPEGHPVGPKAKSQWSYHHDMLYSLPQRSPTHPSPTARSPLTKELLPPTAPEPTTPKLVICRNKHWRYISCYNGPWLNLPPEVLETITFSNFYLPRPQLVDPATLFDLVKIRRLVDDATDLAVRATNGTTSSALCNSHNASNGLYSGGNATALGFGIGGCGTNTKISRERRHRMREHATKKLSHAYQLDEIATSVVTMQSASALEDVAKHVLARNQDDPDATYVHFFHEKIPSGSLASCTCSLPLEKVINQRPTEGALYRTRAVTRTFKEDFAGAATDLTEGLRVCRMYHTPPETQTGPAELVLAQEASRRQGTDSMVVEKDQPSSLEGQLLFHRAGTYLTMACGKINAALHRKTGSVGDDAETPSPLIKSDKEAHERSLEARRLVRTYAKRALRDYTAFISRFDYTPSQPAEITKTFFAKVNAAANRGGRRGQENRLLEMADCPMTARTVALIKDSGHSPVKTLRPSHPLSRRSKVVYSLNELLAAVPPPELPPYPVESTALVKTGHHNPHPVEDPDSSETVTYHPLLTEALHSLLLCHCLIQTSPKELLRHAYMVARLVRISDGFLIFAPARSPARADWIEVVRRAQNWLGLSASWDSLCAPAPFPGQDEPQPETAEQRRRRSRNGAVMEALADERVVDEETFRASVQAREKRAAREEREEEEETTRLGYLSTGSHQRGCDGVKKKKKKKKKMKKNGRDGGGDADGDPNASKRWAQVQEDAEDDDEVEDYPITTERAEAIARWTKEASQPGQGGTGRKGAGKKTGTLRKEGLPTS